MKELLEKLTHTFGPSGYESRVRDLILETIKDSIDEYTIDALGNLLCRKGSKKEGGKRIMVSAHMDEIGLMATHIDENGFVSAAAIGGVRPLNFIGNRVLFINGTRGTICCRPLPDGKLPAIDQLFIDVGATSREDCPVKIGDPAVFCGDFYESGTRWVSKTLDDRIGCLIAIEALKSMKESPNEVWFVFSVQEEVGCRGAMTAAYRIDPDMAIAIDVTIGADTPGSLEKNPKLGAGPCIKFKDAGLVAHPGVITALTRAAERLGISCQNEVLRFAATDAMTIHTVRSGVPSSAVSVACRSVHSPSEMVDKNDVAQAIQLVAEFVSQPVES